MASYAGRCPACQSVKGCIAWSWEAEVGVWPRMGKPQSVVVGNCLEGDGRPYRLRQNPPAVFFKRPFFKVFQLPARPGRNKDGQL